MANRVDIELDDKNDLGIANGDFNLIKADNQHVDLIIESFKGDFKQNPVIGLGIMNWLKSNYKRRELKRAVSVELERDGYSPTIEFDYNKGKLNIDIND